MNQPPPETELVPFEIVREETRQVVFTPPRWLTLALPVLGILAFFGIAALGFFAVFIVLFLAAPLLLIRAVVMRLIRR
jgi:hypothetical protein